MTDLGPIQIFDILKAGVDASYDEMAEEVPPRILVASRSGASKLLNSKSRGKHVKYVVSIGGKDDRPPFGLKSSPRSVLRLIFDDFPLASSHDWAPGQEDVEALIKFGEKALKSDDIILCHCHMGISRSTAAAFILNVMELGPDHLETARNRVYRIRPQVWPNYAMIQMAEGILGYDGELLEVMEPVFRQDPRIAHIFRNK